MFCGKAAIVVTQMGRPSLPMSFEASERSTRLLLMAIRREQDVVLCRNRARTIAAALSIDSSRFASRQPSPRSPATLFIMQATLRLNFRLLGVEPELAPGLPKVSSPLCVTEVLGLEICLLSSPGPINPRAGWAWAFLVPSA